MPTNLRLYHKMFAQICQWLPAERITRCRNLAWLVSGLYLSGAIHLSHIVREWATPGKAPSLVNRLRRFLSNEQVTVRSYYRPLAQQLLQPYRGQTIRLLIDCTKVGFQHRLLTVSIAYRKRALPLVWSVHPGRKGHITAAEQIALLRTVLPLLPADGTVWLMGDSGFQSVPLLRWLGRQGWHFVIRLSGQPKIWQPGKSWQKLAHLPLKPGQTQTLGWVRLTNKHNYGWLWLVLHWDKDQPRPWFLVSDHPQSRQMLRLYAVRMWTDELYGDLKGHGFDLEATHLRCTDRINRLVLAVCIAYVWLLCLGAWLVKRGWRHLIDRKDRRDKSYFRLGLDWLKRCFRLGQPIRLHFSPYP